MCKSTSREVGMMRLGQRVSEKRVPIEARASVSLVRFGNETRTNRAFGVDAPQ
jgi:hypothetical protein